MPRSKPSKTEELRVTLGTKERMLLEEISTSYRIQAAAPALVNLLSDASALYALASIYEMITGRDIPGLINPQEAADFWDAIKDDVRNLDSQAERRENAASLFGGFRNLADFVLATLTNPGQFQNMPGDQNNE